MSIAIVTESKSAEMREVKVGIIGCGGIANGKHMPSLHRLPNVKIVAFCDLIIERAEKAKADFGTEDAFVCTDYRDLLKIEDIEVVHVLTPNIFHAEISIAALDAGKHVMCEKPMATTYADALKMCEASKRNNKFLTIGYQTRSSINHQFLRKMVERGELGEIYYMRAPNFRRRGVPLWGVFMDKEKQGGGPLIDIGTHSIDAILNLANNYDVVSVTGATYRKLADTAYNSNEWGIWKPEEYEVEDLAVGFVKFRNGAVLELQAAWLINYVNDGGLAICGTKGGAQYCKEGLKLTGEMADGQLYETIVHPNSTARDLFHGETLTAEQYEAKQWIYSVVNNVPPVTKPEQAAVVSRVIEAVYKSAETGKTIYFDEEE